MKNQSKFVFLALILALSVFLSACSGGAGVATSWPGISYDEDRQLIYVAYNTFVHAVDTSGAPQWRYPAEADNKVTFFAPPALTPDGQLLVGTYNNLLYSLNPDNEGQLNSGNWPFKAKNRFIAAPLATEHGVFAPSADERLYALSLNGAPRWDFKANQSLWATPSVDGSTIYLAAMDHVVYALDAESGEVVWQSEDLGGAMVGQPAIGPNGRLYVGTFGKEMLALDTQSGEVIWRQPTQGWVWGCPALVDGTLYFGDLQGYFYALNAEDGSPLWQRDPVVAGADSSISARPLVTEDAVYYTVENGTVVSLNRENGAPRWNKTFEGQLYGPPIAAGDVLVVAPIGMDALLIALDSNGNQQWTYTPE